MTSLDQRSLTDSEDEDDADYVPPADEPGRKTPSSDAAEWNADGIASPDQQRATKRPRMGGEDYGLTVEDEDRKHS